MVKRSIFLAVAAAAATLALQAPLSAATGMPAPTPKDKCPVCGMFVSGYKNWIVSVRHGNGSISYFDGPKDMFAYYQNPGKYSPAVRQAELGEILVKDYYSLKPVDARKAWFVVGSDITGPMGNELIPLAKKSDAQAFMTDHKGKRIIRFTDVTPAVLKALE